MRADLLRSRAGRLGLPLALLAICVALSAVRPGFLTVPNLVNLVRQISINGILAVGVTFVLLTGGVDLSLGSLVALSGVVAASFAHPGQAPLAVPILMGALTGASCGTLNGLVVTRGRVAPFIVTLGMMTAARGLTLVISEGKPVSNLRRDFTAIGSGDILGAPVPVVGCTGLS
jgi:ribose/xylose/arabinose/galactoside ABC-type transport system permease subunit